MQIVFFLDVVEFERTADLLIFQSETCTYVINQFSEHPFRIISWDICFYLVHRIGSYMVFIGEVVSIELGVGIAFTKVNNFNDFSFLLTLRL